MKKSEQILKKENGVISVFVAVSIFFMLAVLVGGISINYAIRKGQIDNDKKVLDSYDVQESELYEKLKSKERMYVDTTAKNAIVPAGYEVISSEGTLLKNGLTIRDLLGNEYVWVSVPKDAVPYATYGATSNTKYTEIEKALIAYTSKYSAANCQDKWVSDDVYGLTQDKYNEMKNKMLSSIYDKGGFWVGRYETGISEPRSTATQDVTQKPEIKSGLYPYNYVTPKQAEILAESIAKDSGYTSSLLFGLQWNLIIKFIETNDKFSIVDSSGFGNYKSSSYSGSVILSNAKYITPPAVTWSPTSATLSKNNTTTMLFTTGAIGYNINSNIYDMSGNASEYELAYSGDTTKPVVARGGNADQNGNEYPTISVCPQQSYSSTLFNGFRITIY